jgi:hypothetical protein
MQQFVRHVLCRLGFQAKNAKVGTVDRFLSVNLAQPVEVNQVPREEELPFQRLAISSPFEGAA